MHDSVIGSKPKGKSIVLARQQPDRKELKRQVALLATHQCWKHAIELPYGVWTASPDQTSHGKNLVKWERIRPYLEEIDLKGKSILDVGCSEGFFTLQMSRMGAGSVLGIDASEERITKARFVQRILRVPVSYEALSVYDPKLQQMGPFDLTLCMGFLHRVPDPHGVIERLTRISSIILFEWKCLREGSYFLPMMKYAGRPSVADDGYSTEHWLPSINCVRQILSRYGFTFQSVDDDSRWRRTILIASKQDHPVFHRRGGLQSRTSLLYHISRRYVGDLIRILRGKIP